MKPTDEQIKALRKGDVVTVRAVVDEKDAFCGVRLVFEGFDCRFGADIKPSEIMTIEPREIKVGDRVQEGCWEGEVKAIFDADAWIRYDRKEKLPYPPFMATDSLSTLTVIP